MGSKTGSWLRWRFRKAKERKRQGHPARYSPVGKWQNAVAKVAHKTGTGPRAIVDFGKYIVNEDRNSIKGGKEDLVATIGDPVMFAKSIQNDTEHYRIMLSPRRGDLLDMTEFVKRVVNGVERELGIEIEYAAAIHRPKMPNSSGIFNQHAHLIVKGGFGRGANWLKAPFREHSSREATRQIEQSQHMSAGIGMRHEITKHLDKSKRIQ